MGTSTGYAPPGGGGGGVSSVNGDLGPAVVLDASEVGADASGAAAAAQAASQPVDSDLTAIAALTTTAFGRALLELADAAAGRAAFSLGTAAQNNTGDFDAAGAAAAAAAASQPLDSDLTAIAALSTTAFGRSFLDRADAAAGRTLLVLGNVDNTADTAKPVSTAQQTALNLKADLASPVLTGNPTAPTATPGDNDTSIATTAFVTVAVAAEATARTTADAADPFTAGSGSHSGKMFSATDASGTSSVAEGTGTTAAGNYSHAEGQNSSTTGQSSHAEGNGTVTSGHFSHAQGIQSKASRAGQHAQAAGLISVEGDMQTSIMCVSALTTNATGTLMTGNNAAAVYSGQSTNVLTVPAGVAYAFEALVVAKRQGATDEAAMFKITGLVARTNTGTVRIIGSNTLDARSDAAAATWTVTATADDTNKALALTVTGEAAKNIAWHARLVTSEIVY